MNIAINYYERNNMARYINLYSVKGGQGVSTTAVLLARRFAKDGLTVLLVDRKDGDLYALLGTAEGRTDVRSVSDMVGLLISESHEIPSYGYDVVISDLGEFVGGFENYIVTTPDYLSLRRLVTIRREGLGKHAGIIIVRPANRVLTDRDVTAVLGLPHIATINMSDTVARMSDAGLLLTGRAVEEISFPVTV